MTDLKELLGPVNDYYEGQILEDIANKILTGKLSNITENELFLLQTEIEIASRNERVQAIFDKLETQEQELIDEMEKPYDKTKTQNQTNNPPADNNSSSRK